MHLVEAFLDKLSSALSQRDANQLIQLFMPDTAVAWGVHAQDAVDDVKSLALRIQTMMNRVESLDMQFYPLDSFGNGQALTLACSASKHLVLKNGYTADYQNLRVSFYLVEINGELKVRHSHTSLPWPEQTPFSKDPIQERMTSELSDALSDESKLAPFMEVLRKRSVYTEAGNFEGLMSLQHPNDTNIYWHPQGATLRGNEQYAEHLKLLKNYFSEPKLAFEYPVIFQNDSLACLSAYATSSYVQSHKRFNMSPLRVTYILQQQEGQWLCRHTHWSLARTEEQGYSESH